MDRYPLMKPSVFPPVPPALEEQIKSILDAYRALSKLYQDLNSTYAQEKANCEGLKSKYTSLLSDMETNRNLIYVLATLIAVLVGVTIYFQTGRRKGQPRARSPAARA